MNLVKLLSEQTEKFTNDTAYYYLSDGEDRVLSITYQELVKKAKIVATQLQQRYSVGERAILLFDTDLNFAISFWACVFAGIVAVPVQPPLNYKMLERLLLIVKDANAKFLLTTTDFLSQIKMFESHLKDLPEMDRVTLDDFLVNESALNDWIFPDINSSSNTLIQYTSGSVGVSKGVLLSHGNILSNIKMPMSVLQQIPPDKTEKDSCMTWLPVYHDMGLMSGIVLPIMLGTYSAIMSPFMFLQKPLRWLKALSKYQTTISAAPNFAFELCVKKIKDEDLKDLDLSNWSIALNGAEPVRAETIDKFSKKFAPAGFRREGFYPAYGLAESVVFVTGKRRNEEVGILNLDKTELGKNKVIISDDKTKSVPIVSVGFSWGDQDISIINPETCKPCNDFEIGEIWVSSPSIAKCYWNQEEVSKKYFNAQVNSNEEKYLNRNYLRTEDLGFKKNEYLYITGRIKDLIIIHGHNHYPQHIEQTVETAHPSFRMGNCAVFSLDVNNEEKVFVVQEIKKDALNFDQHDVNHAIQRAVSEKHGISVYKAIYVKAGAIPKTSSGKIQRRLCKKMYMDNELDLF